jgi:hypothetical protein
MKNTFIRSLLVVLIPILFTSCEDNNTAPSNNSNNNNGSNGNNLPTLIWSKALGGTSADYPRKLINTNDNGYMFLGITSSINGDISNSPGQGLGGCWLVKYSASNSMIWQKFIGNAQNQVFGYDILQMNNGNYMVAGSSQFTINNTTGNHGATDFWLAKLDVSGNLIWQKSYGGTYNESVSSITACSDGGFLLAGSTTSNDGDVSGLHGAVDFQSDFWILKVNSNGIIEWSKVLGGNNNDAVNSSVQLSDSSYIISGFTYSNDGDVNNNHGLWDFWVVKLAPNGNVIWKKTFGGSQSEKPGSSCVTDDGGIILVGYTNSSNGDVVGASHGVAEDYWVIKINSLGSLVWQKRFGGQDIDISYGICKTVDGNYLINGWAESNDGDFTDNHGMSDFGIVKIDNSGAVLWKKLYGGSDSELGNTIIATSDGGFVAAGQTYSNDGDVVGFHGDIDAWIIKVK